MQLISIPKASSKRRILHAPNKMIELYTCKMRRLNQLNSTRYHLNATSRIFDWASRIFDWKLYFDPNVPFYMCQIKCIDYVK